MWLLEVVCPGREVQLYYLVGGVSYTIGRKSAVIELDNHDPSLSRHHATLVILATKAADYLDMHTAPEVLLLDVSKHGCFINDIRVDSITRKANVMPGDIMRFGARAEARLRYHPVVATISPTISNAEFKNTLRILSQLGCIVNNPNRARDVTAFTDTYNNTFGIVEAFSSPTLNTRSGSSATTTRKRSPSCVQFGQGVQQHPTSGAPQQEPRPKPVEGVDTYLSPQILRKNKVFPSMMVYVTNKLEIGEPTCMMSMLYGYRPVDIAFLFTLYEVVMQGPTLPWYRWPEPPLFETMELIDRPYAKPPTYYFDIHHAPMKAVEATFRTVHFATLESALETKYKHIIVAGGGKMTVLSPDDVMRHFANGDASMLESSRRYSSPIATTGADGLTHSPRRFGSASFASADFGPRVGSDAGGASFSIRRSNTRRTRKITTCLKLLGLVDDPLDAHGANLRVLVSAPVFDHLVRLFRGDDDLPRLPEMDVRDAALHLFDSGYLIVHEDNIHSALYTCDTAAQLLPNSPGVLARSEIIDAKDETDSDETVEDDAPPFLPIQHHIPYVDHITGALITDKALAVSAAKQDTVRNITGSSHNSSGVSRGSFRASKSPKSPRGRSGRRSSQSPLRPAI